MKRESETVIRYGRGSTMLGDAVVFVTGNGVCALRLLGRQTLTQLVDEMQQRHPNADVVEDQTAARQAFKQVDGWLAGKIKSRELSLDLRGTPFQMQVWKEMLRVPHGKTCSYTELARRVGKPRAVRAVASACARNPVGLLVPCHRIVRQDGTLGGYYWGLDKKEKL
ncbi:MAG TPA: methylated-DNA--[protein]-cysteine S-methyltransferase, partial [Gemmataceae bacterium]|nr:methylated-DNA--[protein]-cysteine S-methyltransferase [Gemmataceae bacterium]